MFKYLKLWAARFLAAPAYSFQSFSLNQVLTSAQMNQVEVNIRDHLHGVAGVATQAVAALLTDGPFTNSAEATLSGTSNDFTSIPSWVKFIALILVGASSTGGGTPRVQIGDSGGIETTGYTSGVAESADVAATAATDSFTLSNTSGAGSIYRGIIFLAREDASDFTWGACGVMYDSGAANIFFFSGTKALTAALDRVRFTWDGVATSDAGVMSLLYA